jgi:hypothetical protein
MIPYEENTRERIIIINTSLQGIPPPKLTAITCFQTEGTVANCRIPGAGSFIRPGKKTDGDTSFLDALKDKYATISEFERIVLDSSGKEIEMIGFDKIEQQQR